MERDYSTVIQTNLLNPSLLAFIFGNVAVVYLLYRRRSKLLTLCYLAFYIAFIPYTGVVLINGVFYEHFLYLPLVFFFAFVVFLFAKLPKTVIIVLLLVLASRNLSRQFDWIDAVRFYSQTLSHAPQSIRIINGLGMAYANQGDLSAAIQTYKQGLTVDPNVPNLYHNLANAYLAQGDLKLAEDNYLKAIAVDPHFLFSWQALAALYQQTGQQDKLDDLITRFKMLK